MDEWNHPTMTRKQFARRAAELEVEEAANPESWWWLSFAKNKFLGVAIVRAQGLHGALRECNKMQINPGGEVVGMPMPDNWNPPDGTTNRLLNREEAEAIVSLGSLLLFLLPKT